MPYVNEHAFRMHEPDKYKDFRRENDKLGEGIDVIFGILDDNTSEIQAIRFNAEKYSFDEAKKWCEEHDFKPILSEEAEPKSEDNPDEELVENDNPKKDLSGSVIRSFVSASTIKEFNDEERTIVHFISTENPDRYGDIVRADGMDDSHYSKNPVVLFGHDHNSLPIGKSLWRKQVMRDGVKGILAKTKFASTQEGTTVYELWKDGFLNSASIGFIPKEYNLILKDKSDNSGSPDGYDFKKWELLEYSVVPVPANGEALRLAYAKTFDSPKIHKFYEEEFSKSILKENIELKETNTILEKQIGDLQELNKSLTEKLETDKQEEVIEKAEIVAIPLTDDLAKSLIREAICGAISKNK